MDYGHSESDRRLAELERRIEKEYKQAYKEVKAKTDKFFEKFEKTDKEMSQKVKQGIISKQDYIEWRKKAMIKGQSLKDLEQSLAQDLVKADKIANKIISGHKIDIYTLNRNYGEYEIENGTKLDLGFSLYNTEATERLIKDQPALLPTQLDEDRDLKWNRQKVSSAITQGILQGESIPNIGKRLKTVVGMDRSAAIRNARTATTGAENAGRVDSYEEAESKGVELEQKWEAVLDMRTRSEHRQLDGQTCPVHGAFEIDGEQIRYPGDPQAPGYLVYNCRCQLVAEIKGIEYNGNRWSRLPEGMTYEEWKHTKDRTPVELPKEEGKKEKETSDGKGKPNSATEYYVSGDGMWINQYLRGRGDFGDLTESEKQFLKDLDTATDGNVKIDTLYRSVDASAIFNNMSQSTYDDLRQYVVYGEDSFGKGKYADSVKEKVGNLINKAEDEEILEKGFMSTTKDKDIAMEFGDFTGSEMPIVMKIDTGGNAHGVDVSIYDKNVDEFEKQEEVLLARNQSYIVKRIYAEDHNICVDVKLINKKRK